MNFSSTTRISTLNLLSHNFPILFFFFPTYIHTSAHTKAASFEFTLTMALLIETCIRIRFDKNCSLCLAKEKKAESSEKAAFFHFSPVLFFRNTQQKRTILSYRISLRILNELWNIIQRYIFFVELSLSVFFLLLFWCYFVPPVFYFYSYFCLFRYIYWVLKSPFWNWINVWHVVSSSLGFQSKNKDIIFLFAFFHRFPQFSAFNLQAIILRYFRCFISSNDERGVVVNFKWNGFCDVENV